MEWQPIEMSHVIPYQKLIWCQDLDLHCYYPKRNIINLSELAPQHRAHQGETHIFFHSFTSHTSLTMPDYAQAHSTRNHHVTTDVPSCMVCEGVLICDLWFVSTHYAWGCCVYTILPRYFEGAWSVPTTPVTLPLSSRYIDHFACMDDIDTIIWWPSKLFSDR
jgi:hypothetical protein